MRGWLFDVYPSAEGMTLWFLDEDGRPHRLWAEYHPAFYAAGPPAALDRLQRCLVRDNIPADLTSTSRQELFSGAELPVTRVAVHRPLDFPAAVRQAAAIPALTLYTCDLSAAQLYLYESGLFPLGRYEVAAKDGALREAVPLTRPEDLEYEPPPLVVMRMRLDGDPVNPTHGWRGELEVSVPGEHVVLSGERPEDLCRGFNRFLARYDPDVLLSDWGDPFLIPRLLRLSARAGVPIAFNRDPHVGIGVRRGRSYVTYGKTVYQAGAHILHGRWHLDLRNSFIYSESEMAGLLEIARLARLPVQRLARTSTGTAISSMQLARAVQTGILVPWHKSEPEGFKTAADLLITDKGGLTYQPLVGVYEGVGELDFSSMYPTIMVRFNVSPETINCDCCADAEPVPEIGHTVCQRRRGLVPQVLNHLLERREYYKLRKRESTGPARAVYDQRQTALKWCLVTCLDGETQVPVKVQGQLRVASIGDIIDGYLPDGPGVLPVRDLVVLGYDDKLRPIENPVKNVIKAPAPSRLLRVRLRGGRELRMIPEHRCFVVEGGRLIVKRAAELKAGDLIPVTHSVPARGRVRKINLVKELFQRLPAEEHHVWRVFGEPLENALDRVYPEVRRAAKGRYTDMTIWNWREYGYLPLTFLSHVRLRQEDYANLHIGRGKREGGLIQRLPAQIRVDQDLGFLLGFFVGDGSARPTFMRFCVGQSEPDVARYIRRVLAQKFHIKSSLRRERKAKMYVVQVNSIALVRVIETVFGMGRSADNGKVDVPSLVWNGSEEVRVGFLSGLLASDGCVGRERTFLRISSAYESFLRKVGLLLVMSDLPHRHVIHGHMYSIEIVREGVLALRELGWLSRKHRRRLDERLGRTSRVFPWAPKRYGPFICHEVRSIEMVAPSSPYVYCFEVEKELHGFVVSGGIFTSNSFGYLGFRNARYGRIEAHESTTAYSREMLLRAKELAEAQGFRMLHAIVDSMWLQKPGAGRKAYEALARDITGVTNLPVYVEGVYGWVSFLPSKTHPGVGVPNRYLGVFEHGETKVRGIEVRRSDTPGLIEEMQARMLQEMFAAPDIAALLARLPRVLAVLEETLVRLREGSVRPADLALTTTISQEVPEYRSNHPVAVAARAMAAGGIHLHPGEAIQYVITDADAKLVDERVRPLPLLGGDWSYDRGRYAELVIRAAETVLEPFGYTAARLRQEIWEPLVNGEPGPPSRSPSLRRRSAQRPASQAQPAE